MNQADRMMETVENIIVSHFGCKAEEIGRIENVTNNSVYPFTVAGEQEYELFRNIFLKHYRTSCRKDEFDVFENAYHVYSALDSLIFSVRVGNTEMESRLKRYLEGKANED